MVVKFKSECNGQYDFGSVALPVYSNDLQVVQDMGVFLYKGMKSSIDGKKYHDNIYFFTKE